MRKLKINRKGRVNNVRANNAHIHEYAQFHTHITFSGNSGAKALPPKASKHTNLEAQKRNTIAQIAWPRVLTRPEITNAAINNAAKAKGNTEKSTLNIRSLKSEL
jgi:hypothetical protein